MKVLLFEVKSLFYSYKAPIAYQVKASNMLPPPSALLGAVYRNYVRETSSSYSKDSLSEFLRSVAYAGFAVLPVDDRGFVSFRKFVVLLKHWRLEKDEEEPRPDAMLREYVYMHGRLVGVIAYNGLNNETLTKVVETIEYLGNSESLIGIRALESGLSVKSAEECGDGYMTQMISSSVNNLPRHGVIEQCGRVPRSPWGGRETADVCYVWNPLEPAGKDLYRPIRFGDIRTELLEDLRKKVACVESVALNARLVFTSAGFECLKRG
ncbi:CRISPR-associated protein Cas5 family [Ignisphaera aggregans DSM 17230]|uniref:CRISPR-associated protein Cas5 family n=1 Tax=Ignisphaera aggregans (strain DSM 17230 / JCM 13409 / AQ1.S1) TaxID=583356 RepID=E0STW5_IGNAA|nr:CRISPR-associated protein Cas5 family [Ignisphaera aggregans DSM 17230]